MHVLLATDAWHPQVNGVVRTLSRVCDELHAVGTEVEVVAPGHFASIPCPTYPEIRLASLRPVPRPRSHGTPITTTLG